MPCMCRFASGPVSANGATPVCAPGGTYTGVLDLATGDLRVTAGRAGRDYTAGTIAHGVLSVVAMAVLLPVSVAVAHCLRNRKGWFPAHIALGLLSMACMIVGTALGTYHWRGALDTVTPVLLWHIIIGFVVMAFLLNQALAVLVRPHPGTKYRCVIPLSCFPAAFPSCCLSSATCHTACMLTGRRAWNVYHHSIGHAAIILGFAASYTGFEAHRRHERPLWWGFYPVYAALPLVWFVCTVAMLANRNSAQLAVVLEHPGAPAKGALSV